MRWTAKRKAMLIRKYKSGAKREVEAILKAENIGGDEFCSWLYRFDVLGLDGLKVSKVARVL